MRVLIGLDPGGRGNFGWCIVAESDKMPVEPIASGLADHSHMAIANAHAAMPKNVTLVAAGIDAPLFWSRIGSRCADLTTRDAFRLTGAPHASGTVQDVNSLRGACLVQGMLAALSLRELYPSLPITESHPKALISLYPAAKAIGGKSEHERDALLSAVAAWALSRGLPGWRDLYLAEPNPYSPITPPLHYFSPSATEHD